MSFQLFPNEIDLKLGLLHETWWSSLEITSVLGITSSPTQERHPRWECAINESNRILFTQLISSADTMRDGYYEYILAVDQRFAIIGWNEVARIVRTNGLEHYSKDLLKNLADAGARIITFNKKPFRWRQELV